MVAQVCRAENPATCRYHGQQLPVQYGVLKDEYRSTGILPKVLFTGQTVDTEVNSAELVQFESFNELNTQSFGFPPYKGEDVDLTSYVEIPFFDTQAEEVKYVEDLLHNSTHPVDRARYETILGAVSRKDADDYLENKQKESINLFNRLIRASTFETDLGDSAIIHTYGKKVDAIEGLNTAEKAIVLWESLKKHHDFDAVDLGQFGDASYEKVVTDTWNLHALLEEEEKK